MRRAAALAALALAAGEAAAQHADHQADPPERDGGIEAPGEHSPHQGHESTEAAAASHGAHDSTEMPPASLDAPAEAAPPAALSGPEHAADLIFGADEMAAARALLRGEHGAVRTQMVLVDRLETRSGEGEEIYGWDVQGWYGGDIEKLWWKSEGSGDVGDNPGETELQVLYSRAITPFFDFQAGVRHDFEPSPQRSHVVLGVEGVLPYVFQLDAAAFVSDDGDLTGRVEAEYDLRILQRLVLQPRIELDFSAQIIPELGIGSGLGSVEAGFRLRYELRRELAPYLGLAWERKRGGTGDFARAAGDDPRSLKLVLGIRAWF